MPHYAAFFDSSATALQKDTRLEQNDSIFLRTNPANTSEVVYSVELGTAADVDRAVAAANASRRAWASKTAPQRNQVLRACVEAVVAQKEKIAHVIMQETGRPFPFCVMEVSTQPVVFFSFFLSLFHSFVHDQLTRRVIFPAFGSQRVNAVQRQHQ